MNELPTPPRPRRAKKAPSQRNSTHMRIDNAAHEAISNAADKSGTSISEVMRYIGKLLESGVLVIPPAEEK